MSNNPRSTYTASFKLQVVAHAEATGNRVAGREYGVNESVVRRWRKFKTQYENLQDKDTRKSFKVSKLQCATVIFYVIHYKKNFFCGQKGTHLPLDARLSSVGVIAYDTYPDEVTVKIELNPLVNDHDSRLVVF